MRPPGSSSTRFHSCAKPMDPARRLRVPGRNTVSIDRSFSAVLPLDMRNGGPNLMTLRLLTGPAGTSAPSAEQQAAASALIMRVDDIANWMNAGPTIDENASAEAQQAAMLAFMEWGTARPVHLGRNGDRSCRRNWWEVQPDSAHHGQGAGKVMVPDQSGLSDGHEGQALPAHAAGLVQRPIVLIGQDGRLRAPPAQGRRRERVE